MKGLAILALLAMGEGCARHKPTMGPSTSIVIPLACLTSDLHMEQCDANLENCKVVRFRHVRGCEQLEVGK